MGQVVGPRFRGRGLQVDDSGVSETNTVRRVVHVNRKFESIHDGEEGKGRVLRKGFGEVDLTWGVRPGHNDHEYWKTIVTKGRKTIIIITLH